MRLVLVVIAAAAGCSPAAWRRTDIATLLVSDAMLSADAIYTTTAAGEHWSGGREEGGMLARAVMGPTPGPGVVNAYFFGAVVLNTALWAVLPPRWRSLVPGVAIGVQANALAWNYAGCRWCPLGL